MPTKNYPGDSGPIWEVGYENRDGALVDLNSNYTCKLVAVRKGRQSKTVDRAVTEKNDGNDAFMATLTTSETADLGEGTHNIAVWIYNAPEGVSRRRQFDVLISKDGVPLPV